MMKKIGILIVVCLLSGGLARAQEMKGSSAQMQGNQEAEQEAMMAQWQEYSTPAAAHQLLDVLVGSWDYTMKHWMNAQAPVEETTGTSEGAWIMEGRYIEEKVTGTSMGQPFQGVNLLGHNNASKQYTSYWYDSMSTGSIFSQGTYDATTQTISSAGTFFCFFRGQIAYRSELTLTDEDHHVYKMYMTETDGTEFLAMRIDYTRK